MSRTYAMISRTLAVALLVAVTGLTGPTTVVAQTPTVFTVLDFAGRDSWFGTLAANRRGTLALVLPTRNLFVTDMTFSNFGTVRTCARLQDTSGPLTGKILVPPESTVTISLASAYQVGAGASLFVKNCSSNPTELEYSVSGYYIDLTDG